MVDIAELDIRLRTVEVDVANTKLDLLERRSRRAERATTGLGGGFRRLTRTLGPLIAGLGGIQLIRSSLQLAGGFRAVQVSLTGLTGSAETANRVLQEMRDLSQASPFRFQGLAEATKRMIAFGLSAEQVSVTMPILTDAIAGLGGGTPELRRVIRAIGQIQAKGITSTEELNQLAEAGINARKALADELGVSVPEALRLVERRAVDATTTLRGLFRALERDFGGQGAELVTEFKGAFTALQDQFDFFLREVGQALIEEFDLVTVIKDANGLFKQLGLQARPIVRGIAEALREVKRIFGEIKPLIRGVAAAFLIMGSARIVTNLLLMGKALLSFVFAADLFNRKVGRKTPIGLIFSLLLRGAAISTGVAAFAASADEATGAANQFDAILRRLGFAQGIPGGDIKAGERDEAKRNKETIDDLFRATESLQSSSSGNAAFTQDLVRMRQELEALRDFALDPREQAARILLVQAGLDPAAEANKDALRQARELEKLREEAQRIKEVVGTVGGFIDETFANALDNVLRNTRDWKERMVGLFQALQRDLERILIVQPLRQFLLSGVSGLFKAGGGSGVGPNQSGLNDINLGGGVRVPIETGRSVIIQNFNGASGSRGGASGASAAQVKRAAQEGLEIAKRR